MRYIQQSILQSQFFIFFLVLASFLPSCHNSDSDRIPDSFLEENFQDPASRYGPGVFWQWMNGNISRDGIIKDLEAMHAAGIKGGIIFNNAVGIPRGPVIYGSDEWIDLTVFAFQEAERLGMEFMIHNAPGYSGTGGPWITPEHSMQQLVWTESIVKGGGNKEIMLPQPYAKMGWYKDAMVVAYPSLKGEEKNMKSHLKRILVNGVETDKSPLWDCNFETKVQLIIPEGSKSTEMIFEFDEPFLASSILIRREKTDPPGHPYDGPRDNPPVLTLECSDDGKQFRRLAVIQIPAQRALEIPTPQNFVTTKARYFRILSNKETNITEMELSPFSRIEGWSSKVNFQSGNARVTTNLNDFENPFTIDKDQVIDLSSKMTIDGKLIWDVPSGNWTILRIGHTTTGEEQAAAPEACVGLDVDKLSKKGVDEHYNKFLKKVFEKAQPYLGKSFTGITVDSWEVGVQNWTSDFDKEFQQRNGYNMVPYAVALTGRYVGNSEETERFLHDFNSTQEEMLAENYYGHLRDICHKNNLILAAEPYGDGQFSNWQVGTKVDVIMGEFWVHGLYGGATTNLNAGYIAHTNGLKIAGAEAFTAMPDLAKFTEYPSAMKADGDWMFTNGINQLIFHVYAHQPHPDVKPGMTMGPFGTHFNRNNNWLEQAKPWFDYLRRCQFMLQNGIYVADACYYAGSDGGAGGSQLRLTGLGLDIIGKDVFLSDADVKEGKLILPDGMSYPVMIFPDRTSFSLKELEKLNTLLQKGLKIYCSKPVPEMGLKGKSTQPGWDELVDKLWGATGDPEITEIVVGKGMIYQNMNPGKLFDALKLDVDFDYESDDPNALINYIHRKSGSLDYYFVANNRRNNVSITASFRIEGKQPELWHPETGKISPMMLFRTENGRTTIPLDLKPSEGVFIVFREDIGTDPYEKIVKNDLNIADLITENPDNPAISELTNDFTIEFWIKPDVAALNGKGYLLYPLRGEKLYTDNHASIGLTAGQNGIRVFEQSGRNAEMVLYANKKIEGWTHLALVYRKGKPEVFLNGEKSGEGKTSPYTVHPNLNELADVNQLIVIFQGENTKPVLHHGPLNSEELKTIYYQGKPAMKPFKNVEFEHDKDAVFAWFKENGNYNFVSTASEKEVVVNEILPEIPVNNAWRVKFPSGAGAPQEIQLAKLLSLHRYEDFGVRHFSGTATYLNHLNISSGYLASGSRLMIDLGDVAITAEVLINGVSAGYLWKPPFETDITRLVREGENMIEIKVNNLWVNRLIGDEYLPVENEYDRWGQIKRLPEWYLENSKKPEGRITFTAWKQYDKDGPLVESGLTGPVKIVMQIRKKI